MGVECASAEALRPSKIAADLISFEGEVRRTILAVHELVLSVSPFVEVSDLGIATGGQSLAANACSVDGARDVTARNPAATANF